MGVGDQVGASGYCYKALELTKGKQEYEKHNEGGVKVSVKIR